MKHPSHGFFNGLRRNLRVDTRQPIGQALYQDNVAVSLSLGKQFTWGDVWPMNDRISEALKPCQRGLFDRRFGQRFRFHPDAPGVLASPDSPGESSSTSNSPSSVRYASKSTLNNTSLG